MPLLGIELLNMRLEGQCLNHRAIWARILHQQKILNKNNFTYRGIFAIYIRKQLVVHLCLYWIRYS